MRLKFITITLLCSVLSSLSQPKPMENYILKPLPYAINALEPTMSSRTLELHWGKHLATYITNYNNLKVNTEFENLPLVDAVLRSQGGLFNNAAQIFNHEFFFTELSPNPQLEPSGKLKKAIDESFGSLDKFKEEFAKAALGQFGSGWAWLCEEKGGRVVIVATPNAENPMRNGLKPLMNLDVWEHSYYVDYQNRRADYTKEFWKILDWKVVDERYAQN